MSLPTPVCRSNPKHHRRVHETGGRLVKPGDFEEIVRDDSVDFSGGLHSIDGDQDAVRAVQAAEAILDLGGARRIAELGQERRDRRRVGSPCASDLHGASLPARSVAGNGSGSNENDRLIGCLFRRVKGVGTPDRSCRQGTAWMSAVLHPRRRRCSSSLRKVSGGIHWIGPQQVDLGPQVR